MNGDPFWMLGREGGLGPFCQKGQKGTWCCRCSDRSVTPYSAFSDFLSLKHGFSHWKPWQGGVDRFKLTAMMTVRSGAQNFARSFPTLEIEVRGRDWNLGSPRNPRIQLWRRLSWWRQRRRIRNCRASHLYMFTNDRGSRAIRARILGP